MELRDKIRLIKLLRQITPGLDLADAKMVIEHPREASDYHLANRTLEGFFRHMTKPTRVQEAHIIIEAKRIGNLTYPQAVARLQALEIPDDLIDLIIGS
jgi:hypothetical protein